jgi:Uma2 family endonuclease
MGMSQVKLRAMTVADYRQMPETGPRYQLVQGRFYMSPAPNRFHQQIVMNIAYLLRRFLEDHPIGEVYISPFDVYLTENDAYQPDVLYVSNANKGILTDQGAEGAPDLAVEVLSRKTSFLDLGTKRDVYARTGVIELWIADPEALTVAIYRLQEDGDTPAATYDARAEFSSALLPGLIVRVADVFKRL